MFGYSWDILPFYDRVARELPDPCRVVEIGSLYGRSILFLACRLAEFGKKAEVVAVDLWQWDQHPKAYETFLGHRDRLAPDVVAMRCSSADGVRAFRDGELDFVFIDADHSYEAVLADIEGWRPKVKAGGILSGHDYAADNDPHVGVGRAVRESFRAGQVNVEASVWSVRVG